MGVVIFIFLVAFLRAVWEKVGEGCLTFEVGGCQHDKLTASKGELCRSGSCPGLVDDGNQQSPLVPRGGGLSEGWSLPYLGATKGSLVEERETVSAWLH